MKVLGLNTYFLLPNNFDGKLSDALRLMADYYDEVGKNNPKRIVEPTEHVNKSYIWNDFLKIIKDDCAMTGTVCLSEYVDGKWIQLDENFEG